MLQNGWRQPSSAASSSFANKNAALWRQPRGFSEPPVQELTMRYAKEEQGV